jgi:CIC family chloride channel protein
MYSPPKIIFSRENMQLDMEKHERSGAWNLPVVENNTYLGFVSKAKIFNAYRKKLQRQKEE